MSWDEEYVTVRCGMLLALPQWDFHREAEDIHNQWLEELFQERVQSNDNPAK
jgi:hypothetical protein